MGLINNQDRSLVALVDRWISAYGASKIRIGDLYALTQSSHFANSFDFGKSDQGNKRKLSKLLSGFVNATYDLPDGRSFVLRRKAGRESSLWYWLEDVTKWGVADDSSESQASYVVEIEDVEGDEVSTEAKILRSAHTHRRRDDARTAEEIVEESKTAQQLKRLREENKRLSHKLIDAQQCLDVYARLGQVKPKPIVRREFTSGLREATAVVLCSDWHVEETVEAEKVNYLNEYNLEVADHRIDKLIDGVLWLLDMHSSKFKIRDLVLWLGGDLMSGFIHDDLVESNALSPIETCQWLKPRVYRLIDTLLAQGGLEQITVPCNAGNHGRTTAKSRVQTYAENSFEWGLYQDLAEHYKQDARVQVIAPKSQLIYLDVYDFVLRFAHGDQVNYGGGVGGVTVSLNKAVTGWNVGQFAHVTNIGHFHQLISLDNIVVNGSLIGVSPYSIRIKAPYEAPRQAFYLIDSKRGKTASYPLWVTDRDESNDA